MYIYLFLNIVNLVPVVGGMANINSHPYPLKASNLDNNKSGLRLVWAFVFHVRLSRRPPAAATKVGRAALGGPRTVVEFIIQ